jgi:hypothetical protein
MGPDRVTRRWSEWLARDALGRSRVAGRPAIARGEGFRTDVDHQERPIGFFTTRFVDAASELEAQARAVAVLRSERKFRFFSRSLPSERVAVESNEKVSFWTHRFPRPLGYTFFMWEQGEQKDSAELAAGGNAG